MHLAHARATRVCPFGLEPEPKVWVLHFHQDEQVLADEWAENVSKNEGGVGPEVAEWNQEVLIDVQAKDEVGKNVLTNESALGPEMAEQGQQVLADVQAMDEVGENALTNEGALGPEMAEQSWQVLADVQA